ncbi:hypothetical protein Vadar_006864 [Vaccinium darrowii]|uniref:Uncharacterized protein n=1 Tax=Vaccinium darrowii TaxID=229202 RepID=A0ACB7WZ03_9ERIC|nr:hypothetical protein Vadar_006864 [Vaccinium darrowii]
MVVNSMLVTMAANANQASDDVVIYQVGSSVSNPIRLNSIQNYGQIYFQKHPWIGKDGKAVKVGNITWSSSMASFHRYIHGHSILASTQGITVSKYNILPLI